MVQRKDMVFQLSLAEIAFTICFLLLFLLGCLVFMEQTDRQAAEAALAEALAARREAEASYNAVQGALASVNQDGNVLKPDDIITRLAEADRVRGERDRLLRGMADLDDRLTTLAAFQEQLQTQLNIELEPGREDEIIREVVAAARDSGDLAKTGAGSHATLKENADLRGRIAFLQRRLEARGGRDFPPCWADEETGRVEFLFNVQVEPDRVTVTPAWPTHREADARALPGMERILSGGPMPNREFVRRVQGIFNQSESLQCRHFVRLKSAIKDAVQSDRSRLMIESYFYKSEIRR